jgi:enamine deaminase RidA (YjgF/YER057c/UK114 family)
VTDSSNRRTIRSGSRWEPLVGYARAVRVGDWICVSGTVGDGADAYQQTRSAIVTIARALGEAGAALSDVVRTRIFVTDIERDWELVARAHREAFARVEPACSMVEVARLIAPEFVVEIEADALTR